MLERDAEVLSLIERALGANPGPHREEAFTRLYETFHRPLMKFLIKATATYRPRPHDGDIEEIAQGAMTSALTRLAGYDSQKASFFTWLAAIGRHEALAWLAERRRHGGRQAFSQDQEEAPQVPFPQDVQIEALVFHRELFGGMARAILSIRNRLHRLVMGMVYLGWFNGLDEMAQVLGENYNTLKSAYRRGVEDMCSALASTQDDLFIEMARRACEVNKDAHAARGMSAADPSIVEELPEGVGRELASRVLLGGMPLDTAAERVELDRAQARRTVEEVVTLLLETIIRLLSSSAGSRRTL